MVDDEPIFASEKVEYYGQVMGALICQTKNQGLEALNKVIIEYEELDFVLNLKHAMNQNLKLHDQPVLLAPKLVER